MAVMKCVRITIIMKMGFAAVLTMNMVTSAGMITAMSRNTSTAMTKRAAAAKLILMKNMNIITATMFRVTRRTVSAKSAIRTKNTATCAAKALKTAPAACRTLTA